MILKKRIKKIIYVKEKKDAQKKDFLVPSYNFSFSNIFTYDKKLENFVISFTFMDMNFYKWPIYKTFIDDMFFCRWYILKI